MPVLRSGSAASVLLATVCTATLGVASTSAFMFGVKALIADAVLVANEGWIMGGTGVPDPSLEPGYISNVESLYLGQYTGTYDFHPLITPE